MRYAELALYIAPFAMLLAWWLGARRMSWRVVVLFALLLAAYGAGLLWLGNARDFTGTYSPAQLLGGQIVREPAR